MASDGISRRAMVAQPRRLPTTLGPAPTVAAGPGERRSILLLLAALPMLIVGGCDFGGDEDDDDDGDD